MLVWLAGWLRLAGDVCILIFFFYFSFENVLVHTEKMKEHHTNINLYIAHIAFRSDHSIGHNECTYSSRRDHSNWFTFRNFCFSFDAVVLLFCCLWFLFSCVFGFTWQPNKCVQCVLQQTYTISRIGFDSHRNEWAMAGKVMGEKWRVYCKFNILHTKSWHCSIKIRFTMTAMPILWILSFYFSPSLPLFI